MQEHELELSVGDSVQIGDRLVTVVEIDGSEISFRIDAAREEEPQFSGVLAENAVLRTPR